MERLSSYSRDCINRLLDYEKLLNEIINTDKILYNLEMKRYENLYEKFINIYHEQLEGYSHFIETRDLSELYGKLAKSYNAFRILVKHITLTKLETKLKEYKSEIYNLKRNLKNARILYEKAKEEYEKKLKNKFDFEYEPDEKLIESQKLIDTSLNTVKSVSDIYKNLKEFDVRSYDEYNNSYKEDYKELFEKYESIKSSFEKAYNEVNNAIKILE